MTTAPLDSLSRDPDLVPLLRASEVFGRLSDDELRDLADRMTVVQAADGDLLSSTSAPSDTMFIVLSGEVAVSGVDRHGCARAVDIAGPGSIVGEANVVSGASAAGELHARGPSRVAALPRAGFRGFIDAYPAAALHITEALRPRMARHRLWSTLHCSEMFGHVDPALLAELAAEFELVALYGGETLFRQGDAGDSLYIVVTGRLRVTTVANGEETVLAELGAGETVGEMAVISGEPRSATVYAMRDTQLARLSKSSIGHVVDRHPRAMMLLLASRLSHRLRAMSAKTRRRSVVATVAVVPAAPGVDLDDFAGRLSRSLSRMGPTSLLTSAAVDAHFGREGAAQTPDRDGGSIGLVDWLAEQETKQRFVVYRADHHLSPWTERCIRQADRVVLVADGAANASPGEIETELLSGDRARSAPVTLVLVHARGVDAPKNTAAWLAGRAIARHLHVRRGADEDHDRVARFITGTALGIALGGGFARGLAHLGVLRALRELNIPVDAIGAASMGAMIGAQCVMGQEAPRIAEAISSGFAKSFDDMTLPFLSFKRGGKASRFVRKLFGDVRIEDLWLPYFCVSANLNRAEVKVHTSGSLADAVLASSRAPGIFPPVVMDGELHVDGGLINNVPVDIMRTFVDEGVVIGVDVSPPHELNQVADYGEDVPGWRAAWHRFNPTRHRRIYRPSILLVLMRVIEFGGISYRREKAAGADVYISPDVLQFKRNDFHAAAEIADAGYRAARETLLNWLAAAPADVRSLRPDLFTT
jgi:predicted acylesterase/phospholipase RssA/CRP-like cAMP-binding protein